MVDLQKKKVGIVACSGEEMPEGTVTRLATLKVLEEFRPKDTVTICLPLFLAGGEGDRAFARFYPTIAVDGCEKRCAARATERYSGKPAASILISDLLEENGLEQPAGLRHLDAAGKEAVDATAERMAAMVDDLLSERWSRTRGEIIEEKTVSEEQKSQQAGCACGAGVPVQEVPINGQTVTIAALPLIFQNLQSAGKTPSEELAEELLDIVKIYNPIPQGAEQDYALALLEEYSAYYHQEDAA